MKAAPRLRSRFAAAVVVLALVMQVFDPSLPWRMLLVCSVALLALSYVWARSLGQSVSLTRRRRYGWAQVGDRIEERFELANDSAFPLLWLEIEDASTLPGYTAARVEAAGPHSAERWTLDQVCTRRGVYRLGPMVLRCGDPFGLFEVTLTYPASETFVVYPPVARLPHIELPRGSAAGSAHVRRRALEWTTNAAGVRQYAPGDQPRSIHWPVSAKHGTLFVKEFDLEPSGDVWVILDLDAQCHVGLGAESTEEYSVIFAASLLNAMLAEGRAVGIAVSGASPTLLPPTRGSDHLWRVLRVLAVARLAAGSLGDFLTSSASSLGRGLTLVIITPSINGEWLGPLAGLQRQGLAAHVVLVDPASFADSAAESEHDWLVLAHHLAELGIAAMRIQRGYRFEPIMQGKRQGELDYVVGATGRIILRQAR